MNEKMEIIKKIAEGVSKECTEHDIEYVFIASAKEAGKCVMHSEIKDTVLKEIISIAQKLLPNK